jgi:hypothetical protein
MLELDGGMVATMRAAAAAGWIFRSGPGCQGVFCGKEANLYFRLRFFVTIDKI